MSTKEVDASARPASSASSSARRGMRGFADRWPFQRKLNVLVGIPLTVIALLLTYLIVDLVQESDRASDAAQLVRDSTEVAQLVADLQDEHQQAILLSVRHEAAFDAGTPSSDGYRQAQLVVDTQVNKVIDAFDDRLPDAELQALKEVQGLAGLRSTIEQGYLPADNIDPAYSGAADGLIDGLNLDRDPTLATTFTGSLLDSLLRADAAHGAYETGVFSARTGDSNALIEFTGAVGSYEVFTYQAQRFDRFADDAQSEEFSGIEHNSSQASITQDYAELAVDPSALQAESKTAIRASFREALASYPDYSSQAAIRLKITASLIDRIADRADDAASGAQWRAGLLLSLALLCFALWIAFSVLVRRSVVRPVLALTGAAQEVADVAGRELARVADDDAEESGPPRLRELPVTADDEIGELAEAFNNVQTTAAALLERQVLSRRNVAEMFGNVGRRVSNLTTRQLALIDAVERGETDPALLARLYSIDHIAVRLRRNADSLMLLAGIRETVLDAGPTALTNVVRAALGQIEGFQRVRLRVASDAVVEPDIIGDLTLMIAELLENAVSFSPEGSPVEVVVGSDGDGASLTVSDHGLGMSADRLAEENARLVRRERLDVVPTKVLGLFVVGALARRWDVDVTLSRTPGGGVTAEVLIPSALLLTAAEEDVAGAADRPGATGTPAAPSAAALPSAVPSAAPPAAAPAALSAPAAGPSPSASVPSWAARSDDPAVLPRRVPRRGPSPADPEGEPPLGAKSRAEDQEPTTGASTADTPAGPRTGEPAAHARTDAAGEPARTAVGDPASARPAETGSLTAPARQDARTGAVTVTAGPGEAPAEPAAGPRDGTPGTGHGVPAPRSPLAPRAAAHLDAEAHARATEPPVDAGTPEPAPHSRTAQSDSVPHARTAAGPYGGSDGGSADPADSADSADRPGLPARHTRSGGAAASGGPAASGEPAAGGDGARPLRRRVRGATLRTTAEAAAQQAARSPARPADADAVRSALEEFEAAVAQAHRDSGGDTGEHPAPAGVHDGVRPGHRPAEELDHRPGHRPDDRLDQPHPTDQPHRTDRTAPSDPSAPSEPSDGTHPIADPIAVRDTPHHQNHLPEGAEQ
ncbi:HAMP domain-containing protein [Streptomyces sp. NBC_00704]|uniref:sensor histidine kinase n=1 Tax=Streptomyces sp. NBC_00704 TaxID=2975809 RepID=UPI002E30CE8F|nr:ATP-binding protein [Streptomyces sp. NBC_00704]